MKLKKFILSSILSLGLFNSSVQAAPNVPLFIEEYQNLLSIMLASYKESVKAPLDSRIFDISKPQYYNFLKNSTHREYHQSFLAMLFYNDFKVNNKPTNFCFILFDGKKTKELEQYLFQTFHRAEETIEYLVAHEFGHCIAAHQRVLGKIKEQHNDKQEEQIADMFAIGFFLTRGQDQAAKSVIRQIEQVPEDDIHFNPIALKKFYYIFKKDNPKIKNIYELFNVSFDYFQKINDNPEFLSKEIEDSKDSKDSKDK